MKKLILFLFISIICSNDYAQSVNRKDSISIIPQPVSVSLQKSYFLLKPQTAIILADKNAANVANFLSNLLHQVYGYSLKNDSRQMSTSSVSSKVDIELGINKKPDASIGDEGYTLKVTTQKIILSANKPQGLFYSIQTLMQLLAPGYNSNAQTKNIF